MTSKMPRPLSREDLSPQSQASQSDQDAAAVFDPDVYVDGAPFDALARLRVDAPVHPVQLPDLPKMWLVTRHADVVKASRDDSIFSSAQGNTLLKVRSPEDSAMLPGIDPPRHTHFRKLINQGFTARNVLRLEESIRATARRIVDDVISKGTFDAVPDISAEISLQVIAEVMGVPAEDRLEIFRWSNAIGSLGIEDPDYAPSPQAAGIAGMEMYAYCTELVTRRRGEERRDDIVSALLHAEVDGQRLNDNQLNEFFLLLAVAGNETTRNTLSHGILALSDHPDQRAQLAADPSLIPAAVDELLRWATPVMHFRRTVLKPTVLGDQEIAEGDWVTMHYLSANRDEAVFAEPEQFDIARKDNQHAAFGGGGTHFCLGAQLAKLEMRVMLEELFARVPEFEVIAPPSRLRSSFFHGIKSLQCTTGTIR